MGVFFSVVVIFLGFFALLDDIIVKMNDITVCENMVQGVCRVSVVMSHMEGLRGGPEAPPPTLWSASLHDLRQAASLIPLQFKATLCFCGSGSFPPALLSRLRYIKWINLVLSRFAGGICSEGSRKWVAVVFATLAPIIIQLEVKLSDSAQPLGSLHSPHPHPPKNEKFSFSAQKNPANPNKRIYVTLLFFQFSGFWLHPDVPWRKLTVSRFIKFKMLTRKSFTNEDDIWKELYSW